ncbi:MAG TPA: hypothetical protein VG165_06895 [Solirubrobacteraceae bacterium]|nr:hypothetical protein [Solirubrobacteraceae bacterium]
MRSRGFLAALVVVVLSAGVAAAAARTGASSSRPALAAADVARLLTRLHLPPGAVPSSGPPAGAGSALVAPGAPATPNLVTAVTYWTVPGTPAGVLAFAAAHPPAGGRPSESGSDGVYGTVTSVFETFAFPDKRVLSPRTLGLTAVASGPTSTALLVQAADVWLTPRPSTERVPARARLVIVTVDPALGRTGDTRGTPRRIRVTSRGRVIGLISAVNALPAAQPGVRSCPAGNASRLTLDFRTTAGSPALAVVRDTGDGCGFVSMTLDGRAQPALDEGAELATAVGRILGTRVQAG